MHKISKINDFLVWKLLLTQFEYKIVAFNETLS